jgi:hypothetical protein
VGGEFRWLHTAGNAQHTHLFVHEKCGEQALRSEDSVLKNFTTKPGAKVHARLQAVISACR